MHDLDPVCRAIIDKIVDRELISLGDLAEHIGANAADELVEQLNRLGQRQRDCLFAYWDMRKNGIAIKLAEMLALQAPPMSNTDREFLEGHCNGNQFQGGPLQEEIGNRYKAVAEAAGVNVKGKVYLSGLASHVGDPRAWVSDRSDVQKVCEERGWKCEGSVTVADKRNSGDF